MQISVMQTKQRYLSKLFSNFKYYQAHAHSHQVFFSWPVTTAGRRRRRCKLGNFKSLACTRICRVGAACRGCGAVESHDWCCDGRADTIGVQSIANTTAKRVQKCIWLQKKGCCALYTLSITVYPVLCGVAMLILARCVLYDRAGFLFIRCLKRWSRLPKST